MTPVQFFAAGVALGCLAPFLIDLLIFAMLWRWSNEPDPEPEQ